MKDVELCSYAFGSGEGLAPTDLTDLANNMGNDDQVTVMQTIRQVQAAAGPRAPNLVRASLARSRICLGQRKRGQPGS